MDFTEIDVFPQVFHNFFLVELLAAIDIDTYGVVSCECMNGDMTLVDNDKASPTRVLWYAFNNCGTAENIHVDPSREFFEDEF